ncbi:MAG: dipeptide epimerase [Burkholderiales bacterium]|nr:dipeptide epimerase [Burkholderiales bacterium]
MQITSITIAKLKIPLQRPFITALRSTTHVEDIVVMLKTDSDLIGYGSAAATPAITGETHESIISAIQHIIAPKILGKNIDEFNNLLIMCQQLLHNNYSAKAAVDIALHDLFAQKCHLPLYKMLGGNKNTLESCVTVSVKNVRSMVDDAINLVQSGFKTLKVKVGLNPEDDIERVFEIYRSVGDQVKIILDANQGWSCKDALKVIREFEQAKLNISLIEQPVIAQDLTSLALISNTVMFPIIADEACFSPPDALTIAKFNASDGINIKLMKAGGIYNANAIYHIAQAANLSTMVGCMIESPIGVAAMGSFAASKPNILVCDLDPLILIKENYVMGGAQLINNQIVLANTPGLGISGFSDGLTYICEIK